VRFGQEMHFLKDSRCLAAVSMPLSASDRMVSEATLLGLSIAIPWVASWKPYGLGARITAGNLNEAKGFPQGLHGSHTGEALFHRRTAVDQNPGSSTG
jgi:hypothetical protein